MKTWVVLPAYNEAEALPPLLTSLTQELTEEKRPYRILVVNDGSTDDTAKVVQAFHDKDLPVDLLNNPRNLGLADTLRNGLFTAMDLAAPNDVIITMDADNTHPAALILRMIRQMREGSDVVIASRYREGSRIRGLSRSRQFISLGAAILMKVLFPTEGVRDYTSGYRAYRVKSLMELRKRRGDTMISQKGFSCMVDLLLGLRQQDLIFSEVPLVLRYDQKPGRSKMKVFSTILETLALLFKRRFEL